MAGTARVDGRDGPGGSAGRPGRSGNREPTGGPERMGVVEPPGLACDVERPQAAAAGSPVTWSDVYSAERDGLVRLAYLMTGSRVVAEDLVQDTFIRVMARIDADGRPGPYLHRSVVNACYSWHRRAWREVRPGGDWTPPEPDAGPEGADVEMWDALRRLPPRRRTVLVMRFYLDMTEADVAAALDCRVGTVKSTTHRALADLKRILQR